MPPDTCERLAINQNHHIVLKYFKTTYTAADIRRSQSMRGISGAGLWLVPELVGESYPKAAPFTTPKLMGIFTELCRTSSVAVATKVNFHLKRSWKPAREFSTTKPS